jgi:hypothetical protein
MAGDFGVDPGTPGYQQNVMVLQCLAYFKRPEQMADPQYVLAVKNNFHQKTPLDPKNAPFPEIPKIAGGYCQHFVKIGFITSDHVREPRHYWRDFASDIFSLRCPARRPADRKRSPPHILADEHFNSRDNPPRILADYRTLDGVLKPLRTLPLSPIVWYKK